MKQNKFSLSLLAVAALSLAACQSEYEDTDTISDPASGSGVYFAADAASEYDLTEPSGSFTIDVYRDNTAEAATVTLEMQLTQVTGSGIVTIVPTVTFAAGQSQTTLNVNYAELAYGEIWTAVINVPQSDYNPYATSQYTFDIARPEPWSDWELWGSGIYNYSAYFSGTDDDYPIYHRANKVDPTQEQFYMQNLFYGTTLIWNYNPETGLCSVPEFDTMYESSYGEVMQSDVLAYAEVSGRYDYLVEHDIDISPSYFDAENGVFYFNMVAYTVPDYGFWTPSWEYIVLDGYDHPDYSATISRAGVYSPDDSDDYMAANVTLGANVAYARVACGSNETDLYYGLVDGSIDYSEGSVSGLVFAPLNGVQGECYLMVVTFDAEGNPQEYADVVTEYYPANVVSPWQSIGYCSYTDDLLIPLYGYDPITYQVQVEENTEQPGLYRMVNPYGEGYPYNEEGDYYNANVKVDAQNPARVFIDYQDLGLTWNSSTWCIYSYASWYMDYGYTADEVESYGLFGSYADGKITFPVKTLLIYMDDSGYYGNTNGAWCLDIASAQAEPSAAAALQRRLRAHSMSSHKAVKVQKVGLKKCAAARRID